MARKIKDLKGTQSIPRKYRKQSKGKGSEEKSLASVDLRECTFEADPRGVHVMDGNIRMDLSPYSQKDVSAGEVWMCMVDVSSTLGRTVIPVEKVSDAPETEAVEEATGRIPAGDIEVRVPEAVPMTADSGLKKEMESLKRANGILKVKAERAERLERQCEQKDAEIKSMKRTMESLKNQVKALNEKDSVKESLSRESEIQNLNDAIESKDYEILKLREKLKSLGVDDMAVVPSMPKVPKVVLTGPEAIHCTFLEDGRHMVLVSPNLRSIRVRRDDNGRVWCRDGVLHLSCLSSIHTFEKARPLDFDKLDDCYEIRL